MASTDVRPVAQGNVRALLANRGFRRLTAARLISQFTDGLFQAGLGGSLLFNPQQNTSAVKVAVAFAVLLLPYSLIGPYVGVVLDRFDRRAVLATTNLIRATVVLPAAALLWYGHDGIPFVLCALVVIGVNRLFLAGVAASMPRVVDRSRLVTANAISGTLGTLIYSVGLGLAALALATLIQPGFHGYAGLTVVATLGYAAAALVPRISFPAGGLGPDLAEVPDVGIGSAAVSVARGMLAGIRHLTQRPVAGYAMLAQALHRALYGVLALSTLLLYRHYFQHDDTHAVAGLAQVVLAGGLGGVLAAFVTPPAARRLGPQRWISGLLLAAGVIVVVLGLPFRPVLIVAATFCINVVAQGITIVVNTSIQRECADEYRGRAFSINDTAYNVFFVGGLFVAAARLPPDGHSPLAWALVAVGYVLVSAWYAIAGTRSRAAPSRAR